MKKIPEKIYSRIDNEIYNTEGNRWWDSDFSLSLIRTFINPVRVNYAKKVIDGHIFTPAENTNVLEVGCGGGILSEEFAKMGFLMTGIDPAENSLITAIEHATWNNLNITYKEGSGENLPFQTASFDVVLCCDVLEHVQDLPKVISEVSRVLKTGGIFIYDTFNRTCFTRISIIKILQDWKRWAILPRDLHVWEMFIKPSEIKLLLSENQLSWKDHSGLKPNVSYIKMLRYLHERADNKLTYEEFGRKLHMVECQSTGMMYIGFAVRD